MSQVVDIADYRKRRADVTSHGVPELSGGLPMVWPVFYVPVWVLVTVSMSVGAGASAGA